MSRKATHSGTCQICGSVQKLPSGMLAKHGYTTRWGFFSGVCPGSGFKPFELSTDRIEAAIANATASRATAIENAATERARTGVQAWANVHVRGNWSGTPSHWKWVEVEVQAEPREGYTRTFYVIDGKPSQAECRYSTAEEYAAHLRDKFAATYDKRAAELAAYVEWQRERVASWKPAELTPVK